MSRKLLAAGGGFLLVIGALAAYVWFSGGSGEPSTEVTAPPVAPSTTAVAAPETTVATAGTVPEPVDASTITYTLVKEESTASFALQEDLRGVRTDVVGTTNELAAEILVDFGTPANSQVGQVVINARTLETGSSFRDRAIRGEILDSADDEFEFITFTPTSIAGLPDEIADEVSFTMTGDLTIRTITNPVTFAVTVSSITPERLEGIAKAEVLRSDFDLNIPSVSQVANVTDEVQLTIEFVATAG